MLAKDTKYLLLFLKTGKVTPMFIHAGGFTKIEYRCVYTPLNIFSI